MSWKPQCFGLKAIICRLPVKIRMCTNKFIFRLWNKVPISNNFELEQRKFNVKSSQSSKFKSENKQNAIKKCQLTHSV